MCGENFHGEGKNLSLYTYRWKEIRLLQVDALIIIVLMYICDTTGPYARCVSPHEVQCGINQSSKSHPNNIQITSINIQKETEKQRSWNRRRNLWGGRTPVRREETCEEEASSWRLLSWSGVLANQWMRTVHEHSSKSFYRYTYSFKGHAK